MTTPTQSTPTPASPDVTVAAPAAEMASPIRWKKSEANGVQSSDGRFFISARGRGYGRIFTAYDKQTGSRSDFFKQGTAKAWLETLAK